MVIYDTKKLRDAADCREIAILLGIPQDESERKKISGETPMRFACVAPGHAGTERRYDNFAVYRHHCKCYSCGWGMDTGPDGKRSSKDVFDLVKAYYENYLHKPISFEDVCGIIGDLSGGRELYILDKDGKNGFQQEPFPLTPEELRMIGLDDRPQGAGIADREDNSFLLWGDIEDLSETVAHQVRMETYRALDREFGASCRWTIRDLFYSDREAFDAMVREKCFEAARERRSSFSAGEDKKDTSGLLWGLRQKNLEELVTIRSLYKRLYGEEMEGEDVAVPKTGRQLQIF